MNIATEIVFDFLMDPDRPHDYLRPLVQAALDQAGGNETEAEAILEKRLEAEMRKDAPKVSGVYLELLEFALDLIMFEVIAKKIMMHEWDR